MKKIIAVIVFLLMGTQAKAQVSAVTLISSTASAIQGQQIAVTFTMKGPADFGQYNYDILFSSSNTPDATAYSSSIGGPMVCTNKDVGFPFFNQGSASNVIVKTVTVPSTIYSGFIIVIASEGSVYLTCSSINNNASFSIVNTPTPTNTNTKTATNTATSTPTATNTFTVTPTPTNTNTFTITPTPTNTNTATVTPTPTNTFTLTNTMTSTITNTPYPTLTPAHLPVDNYIQVTATGTVTGINIWIPQSQSGVSISGGGISITGGQVVAVLPTSTNSPTFTPTVTGTINTLTPTPSFTPIIVKLNITPQIQIAGDASGNTTPAFRSYDPISGLTQGITNLNGTNSSPLTNAANVNAGMWASDNSNFRRLSTAFQDGTSPLIILEEALGMYTASNNMNLLRQPDALSNTNTPLGVGSFCEPSYLYGPTTFTSTGSVTYGPFKPSSTQGTCQITTTGTITSASVSIFGSNDGTNFSALGTTVFTLTSFSGTDLLSWNNLPSIYIKPIVTITTLGGTNIIVLSSVGHP